MFEHHSKPLISKEKYLKRVFKSISISAVIIFLSLSIGISGYHYIAHLSWIDSLLNASMILTGMGPVNAMSTFSAKLFASFYALFSGIAFLTTIAVIVAPILHRFLHRLHIEEDE